MTITRTPPLPALRAFAALVRLGSVAAAAQELSLTPGAVTHQIRALESFLNVSLVQRDSRSLVLTEEGRIYGYQVRQALEVIAQASERLVRPRSSGRVRALRVAVLPSFAHGWLIARLPRFYRLHPDVQLHLQASMDFAQPDQQRLDCAIRFGHGHWPDFVVRPLMLDHLVLLASPALLGKKPPSKLEQVLRLPQLQASEDWSAWLATMPDAPLQLQRPPARLEFTDSTHLLEAARAGLGVALSRRSIADALLSKGELQSAHPHSCVHSSAYYALVPAGARPLEVTEQFLAWLQVECARYRKAL